MYNPCYNCPRPNVIRVDEGREAILPKDGGDYYDPLVCPQMCVCGASRGEAGNPAPHCLPRLSHSGKKKGEKNYG